MCLITGVISDADMCTLAFACHITFKPDLF